MGKRLRFVCLLPAVVFAIHLTTFSRPVEGWRNKSAATGIAVAFNPLNPNTIFVAVNGDSGENVSGSYDRGQTWVRHIAPGILQIRQILVHPSDTMTIFCAGSTEMRKSTDGGNTWRTVLPGFTIDGESIVIDPLHPDTMYAAESGAGVVYRSTDRGEHWNDSSLAVNNVSTLSIRPDNANILYAGTGLGSISKSTDGGKNWRVVKHPVSVGSLQTEKIAVSATSPLIAYAAFNGTVDTSVGVWKTTNGGEVWFRTNATGISFQGVDIDPFDPNIVYAGTSGNLTTRIDRSTDGGVSWSSMTIGLPPLGSVQMIKIHPLDPSVKWAAAFDAVSGTGGAYRYGTTSTIISGTVLNAATSDTVKNGYILASPPSDSINIGATGGNFSFYYFDGDPSLTLNVTVQAYPCYRSTQQITFQQGQLNFQNLLLRELDKRTISGIVSDSASGAPRRALLRLRGTTSVGAFEYTDSSDAAGAFHFDSLYITYQPVNRYDDFTVAPDVPYGRQRIHPITLDTNGVRLPISLTLGEVLVVGATDSGAFTFYYQAALESLNISYNIWDERSRGTAPMRLAAEFRKKTLVYYTGSYHSPLPQADLDSLTSALDAGCSLFLTGQDIAEKNDTTKLMKDYLLTGFQANTRIAYVSGIYRDIFYPLGFNTVNLGASNQTSKDILKPLDPRAKTVIGYGYGNLGTAAVRLDSVGGGGRAIVMGFGFEAVSGEDMRFSVMKDAIGYLDGSVVLDVAERRAGTTYPGHPRLDQNYPNPFNPATEIGYVIGEASDVDLTIFDVVGRSVATLVHGRREPGSYSLSWDGGGYPSGTYFYRIISTPLHGKYIPYAETKMMILVK